MNYFYNNCVNTEEKQRISSLEPFDEHEEWHLKCMHYVLITAFKAGTRYIQNSMWASLLQHQVDKSTSLDSEDSVSADIDENEQRNIGKYKTQEGTATKGNADSLSGMMCGNLNAADCCSCDDQTCTEIKAETGENMTEELTTTCLKHVGENMLQEVAARDKSGTASVGNIQCGNLNGAYCFTCDKELDTVSISQGEKNCGEKNEVYTLRLESQQESIRLSGLKRFGHRMCRFYDDQFVIIGGFGEVDKQHTRVKDIALLDDKMQSILNLTDQEYRLPTESQLQVTDLASGKVDCDETVRQSTVEQQTAVLTERLFHSMVKMTHSSKVLLFGGRVSPICALGSLCEIIPCQSTEMTLKGMESECSDSDPRSCHQGNEDQLRFVFFHVFNVIIAFCLKPVSMTSF